MSEAEAKKRSRTDSQIEFTQSWQRYLHDTNEAYRSLREEMLRGWQSKALDKRHDAGSVMLNEKRNDGELYQRKLQGYVRWADTTLPSFAPDVFRKWTATEEQPPRFLDIGCAPGGLSQFLHEKLRWSGIGATLAVSDGGMPMMYKPAAPVQPSAPSPAPKKKPKAGLGSILAAAKKTIDATNARVLDVSPATSYECVEGDATMDDFHDRVLGRSIASSSIYPPPSSGTHSTAPVLVVRNSMDFAMAGAVVDRWQRESLGAEDHHLRSRLAFSLAQLRLAAKALKPGGSLLFVFGPSDCLSLPVVVGRLCRFMESTHSPRIIHTMHKEKTPVYILFRGLRFPASDTELHEALDVDSVLQEMDQINEELKISAESPVKDQTALKSCLQVFQSLEPDLSRVWTAREGALRGVRLRSESSLPSALSDDESAE